MLVKSYSSFKVTTKTFSFSYFGFRIFNTIDTASSEITENNRFECKGRK